MRGRRTKVPHRPGRLLPFVLGIAIGTGGTFALLGDREELQPKDAGPCVADTPPPVAPSVPSTSTRRARRPVPPVPEPKAVPTGEALAALLALTPQLSTCLAGAQGAVPAWLDVDAAGAIRAVRLGRGPGPDAVACAERVLVGRNVGSRRAETLYVEFSAP